MEQAAHPEWKLIEDLGGASKVADLLGYDKAGGAQRVQNWKHRGIPPAVKVDFPHLFMPNLKPAAPSTDSGARAEEQGA